MIRSLPDVSRVAYPLNVFLHVLVREEGHVDALHYGLFERPDESILVAQERSTALLLARLPEPPARLLDVGAGLGTLLHRLIAMGYEAEGLTPDEQLATLSRARVTCARFEDLEHRHSAAAVAGQFDAVIFQESSQYIDSQTLWRIASRLTRRVIVLDEFLLQPDAAARAPASADTDTHTHTHSIHALADFVSCAADAGFRVLEERDLSAQAAPTVDYFLTRIPRHHDTLTRDLGVTDHQLAELIASGTRYRELYRTGVYGYRLLDLAT
jgi:cyclopropane fatty-acyl-phospholipid synthase-like methyltransferase